ncbi:putative disease resistance RPP13-like protein 1 isoform X2 [Cajanus cajan]|uniref:putative disease resistance RPP13-like protein 1 isoform X2 n=1 Tax=Cajanus cajan TaxID=3821 RepID=UPI00098DD447|nr:putative disease resistance RPP13-like protein 1 isoform X2 [Cajanus cajan]
MEALFGGAFLSAFLQVAFDRLASRQVLDFFRKKKLDENLLKKLKRKLRSIDALADDAELQQFRDQRVRAWLLDVKDAVFEAEDLLDEIYESQAQSIDSQVWNFNFSISSVSLLNNENEIETRMTQILDDLDELANQGTHLGLKPKLGSKEPSCVSQKLPSTSFIIESVIYGRDDDKKIICSWLTSDTDNHNKLSILSIVGMGGVGKTTLAQHAYNNPIIEGKFDIKAWVCVSDDFDVFKVTRTILEAITKATDDSRDLQMVHERLKEKLSGKKFLLVLDDVWNEKKDKWEAVHTPLIDCGAHGSRILVTTRSKKVASIIRSKEHHLTQLQEDYCWQLFEKHAFQNANPPPSPDFKEIGMKIVGKCKGLPLALKTMGSLLHNKPILEWKNVMQSEIWELEDIDIVPALALSYHHLPSHLKRCFAYCSLFPKDYLFNKEFLIQVWMTQKFLECSQQSKSPEEIGEQYFNDLLSRSFFQQSSGEEKCFVMHDLLNDLATYVSKDICFRLEVDHGKSIPKITRHLSFPVDKGQCFDGYETLHDIERLRTFMPTTKLRGIHYNRWHCKMSLHELFSKLKFLRFLSLSHYVLSEVPDSVGNLMHLCSLDLSNTGIVKLPESTCSLSNLQILKLNNCKYLKKLPSSFHKLIKLRRLELIYTHLREVPTRLGQLKNLQILMSSFCVGESKGFTIQQLGELNLHGRLQIQNLRDIQNPSEVLALDLTNKTQLVGIDFVWIQTWRSSYPRKEDAIIIDNLKPPKHLEQLLIKGYGGTQFPSWLFDNSLSNVVSLSLHGCNFCQRLPPLGRLSFLKFLQIFGLDKIVSIDVDFYGSRSSSFPSLESLKISGMKNWEKWECEDVTGAFPRLQDISISICPKLKRHLPKQLLCLKRLSIISCEQLFEGKLIYERQEVVDINIRGHIMEAWLIEWIGNIICDSSIECLDAYFGLHVYIPMNRCYNFLKKLKMSGCKSSLMTFPLDIFPTLRSLELSRCHSLRIISQEHTHDHLKNLKIWECPQFESLPQCMHISLPSLEDLCIEDSRNKLELPPDKGFPPNLKTLSLHNCSKLMASIKEACALIVNPSLKYLYIEKLDHVECFPDEGLLPVSLTSLWIENCQNLKNVDYKGLFHLSSLEKIVLRKCNSLHCLPEDLCQLSSLKKLIVGDCSNLQCLPKGLCQLSSLQKLVPRHCPNIQCLPDNGLPESISRLRISGSPLLKQCCGSPEGQDHGKIAHIQDVAYETDSDSDSDSEFSDSD